MKHSATCQSENQKNTANVAPIPEHFVIRILRTYLPVLLSSSEMGLITLGQAFSCAGGNPCSCLMRLEEAPARSRLDFALYSYSNDIIFALSFSFLAQT